MARCTFQFGIFLQYCLEITKGFNNYTYTAYLIADVYLKAKLAPVYPKGNVVTVITLHIYCTIRVKEIITSKKWERNGKVLHLSYIG